MNEYQRQSYLSALGVENYMPRWQLPFAPAPIQCDIPVSVVDVEVKWADIEIRDISPVTTPIKPNVINDTGAAEILRTEINPSKVKPVKISAASILQQLEQKTPFVEVQSFALSVWHPAPGFLIIDSRQTALALPTELFLHNVLRAVLKEPIGSIQEEVLRWPMVENRFVSRTIDHARTELQTWLTVEHELRPINQLWLMGHNAARYLLPLDVELPHCLWQRQPLAESGLTGLILPSLNEFLQQPQLKAQLWAVI